MSIPSFKSVLRRLRSLVRGDSDRFLRQAKGVIHVGANTGQERESYARRELDVIWIEPIPEVFKRLTANIRDFPRQRAIQGLIADRDDVEHRLNIASNDGASSSILDLNLHREVWPDVSYTASISLRSKTLTTLIRDAGVDMSSYDTLVMDTQGSELMVLEGAIPLLGHFRFIKTEVPDFEAYSGCCQLADILSFMARHGYREYSRQPFARRHHGGGRYYDIVFIRSASAPR
jgi:FkbM family methyltransferase